MMPKPPVVWYTDSDAVPIKEVIVNCDTDEKQKDRLSRITDLMKMFENKQNKMTLEDFDREYVKILNDQE